MTRSQWYDVMNAPARAIGMDERELSRQDLLARLEQGPMRVQTTISPEYVKGWGKVEAIREIIQNAIDTGSPWAATYSKNVAVISDEGPGLALKDLLLGGSQKGAEQIGQFGEGLVLALSVCAREGSKILIKTVGFTVAAEVEYHRLLGERSLTLIVERNRRRKGTVVEIECEKEEFQEAKELFLDVVKKRMQHLGDNVYLPGGNVFVVGLRTSRLNLAFSYNLMNKDLTNRDRTIIDLQKADAEIETIISNTQSERVIKAFLENAESNPDALEYRLNIEPRHRHIWARVIKELWPKAVTPTTPFNDFVAHNLGYKVLPGLTWKMQGLLRNLGVPSSQDVAELHKDKGIVIDESRIVYPISDGYAQNWTITDALREIIANARDASDKVSVKWEPKRRVAVISDGGPGLTHNAFVFGGDSAKGSEKIGQFSDGLKMAALVAAREGRVFEVVTKGHTYEAVLEYNTTFQVNFLSVYVRKNRRKKEGTTVYVGCMSHELESARRLFRPKNDTAVIEEGIIKREPGEQAGIYIMNMFAGSLGSYYSYSLTDKSLTNRDRKVVDLYRANGQIRELLYNVKKYKTIRDLLAQITESDHYYLEYDLYDEQPNGPLLELFKKAVKNLFVRKKICLSSGGMYDSEARDRGWEPIEFHAPIVRVLKNAGMPTSSEIASRAKRSASSSLDVKRVYLNKLPRHYQDNWKKGVKRWHSIFGKQTRPPVRLVEELPPETVLSPLGELASYDRERDVIYIVPDAIREKGVLVGELLAASVVREAVQESGTDTPHNETMMRAALRALRKAGTIGFKK